MGTEFFFLTHMMVMKRQKEVNLLVLALPYIFCLVNGEILTKNMRRS